jgi:TP901 family phage tail tape measure protein
MVDSASQKVLAYVTDITDVEQKIQRIESLNKQLAQQMGQDFGKMATVVSREMTKVSDVKMVDTGEIKTKLEQVETVVETTSGKFVKLTETVTGVDKVNKKVASTISDVTSKYSEQYKIQSQLQGKSSDLSTNFDRLSDINRKFSGQLKETGNASFLISKNFTKLSDNTKQVGYLTATSTGKILQFTETIKQMPNGVQKVSRSVKDVTEAYHKQDQVLKPLQENTVSLGDNIGRLVKRAALTIPIWFAMRQGVSAVISTFRDGVKSVLEFDEALQKIKRNLSGTTDEINKNIGSLASEITKLSIETGKSTAEIADAIKKFATIGFDVKESLAGGIGATKLAVLLFGNAGDTANAFARALKVLIDRSKGAKSATEQMNEAFALTAELEKDNQFEINEVTAGLENFATTAKIANLSMQQTLVLLATLGTAAVGGARGGTLLRTSFQKLVENLDKVSSQLGIHLNPQVDTTYTALLKVVDAISKLDEQNLIAVESTGALAEIFGGVRGSLPIQALVALNDQLKKNNQVLPDVAKFNESVTNVLNSESGAAKRLSNNLKEIRKGFVESLFGAENFDTIINNLADSSERVAKNINPLTQQIKDLSQTLIKAGSSFMLPIDQVKTVSTMGGDLSSKLLSVIDKLKIKFGVKNIMVDEAVGQEVVNNINEQLSNEEKNLVVQTPKVILSHVEEQEISKKVLANELDRLKNMGALTSEILKATDSYSKQLKIEETSLDVLERRLNTEKAINDEKRLQSQLGSDSIKLYKIAQEQGTDVAKKIGDVLSGEVDFSAFIRQGGKAAEVFADQWADLFEAKQAEQFFRGERISTLPKKGESGFDFNLFNRGTGKDLSALRGGGNIKIQEEAIRGISTDARIELLQAINEFKQIEKERLTKDVKIEHPSRVEIVGLGLENLYTQSKSPIVGNIKSTSSIDLIARGAANNVNKRLTGNQTILPDVELSKNRSQVGASFQFSSGGINISINAANKEELNKKIDQEFEKMKSKTKEEINNELFGKQFTR